MKRPVLALALAMPVLLACNGRKADEAKSRSPAPAAGSPVGADQAKPGGGAPAGAAALPACPAAPDAKFSERFAVGVVPDHRVPSLVGEAAECHADFTPGGPVASRAGAGGVAESYLASAGTFTGGCPGKEASMTFESVAIDHLGFVSPGRVLELARPDQLLYLTVEPRDRCDFKLSGGRPGDARWSMGPGCDRIVAARPSTLAAPEGVTGFDGPADSVALAPVAAGACVLTVDYLGVKTDVTVTVK